jgi:hypothetical protein
VLREAETRNSQEAWLLNLGTKTSRARDRGKNDSDIDRLVLCCQIGLLFHALWKAVKKQENVLGGCSVCAGGYEDPDRLAWSDVEENEEDTDYAVTEDREE